jgi:hypothetical protein
MAPAPLARRTGRGHGPVGQLEEPSSTAGLPLCAGGRRRAGDGRDDRRGPPAPDSDWDSDDRQPDWPRVGPGRRAGAGNSPADARAGRADSDSARRAGGGFRCHDSDHPGGTVTARLSGTAPGTQQARGAARPPGLAAAPPSVTHHGIARPSSTTVALRQHPARGQEPVTVGPGPAGGASVRVRVTGTTGGP